MSIKLFAVFIFLRLYRGKFRLPGKVETDKIDANYKNGLLKLTLPKTEGSQTKKIEVK
ncbi:MAG TPA: Hsp20 family protein [Desulfatiglandales bacterium]|nr:Hsp20 family protein [Desulfatiglandales bacterium]